MRLLVVSRLSPCKAGISDISVRYTDVVLCHLMSNFQYMNWRNYEHYIFYTFKDKYPECAIEFDKRIKGIISGRSRQIDLYIKGDVAGHTLVVIVDCKYFHKKIDIKIVESFLGFVKDVKGNRGVLITNKGFTKSAYARAANDQNADIKLEIIEFKQLYPFQGPGAIIHRGPGGAVVQAPDAWQVDGERVDDSILVTLLPHGLSIVRAFQVKEVIFCNIMPKDGGLTIKELIEDQEKGRLEFDNKSIQTVKAIKLKRYDKLDGYIGKYSIGGRLSTTIIQFLLTSRILYSMLAWLKVKI